MNEQRQMIQDYGINNMKILRREHEGETELSERLSLVRGHPLLLTRERRLLAHHLLPLLLIFVEIFCK